MLTAVLKYYKVASIRIRSQTPVIFVFVLNLSLLPVSERGRPERAPLRFPAS